MDVRWRRPFTVCLLVATLINVFLLARPAVADDVSNWLRAEGLVDSAAARPLLVHPATRRLFANVGHGTLVIRKYDLDRPYGSMGVDGGNDRALILDHDPHPQPDSPYCSYIRVLSLNTLRLTGQVWRMNDLVPNYYPEGLTYSPIDHLLTA